MSTALHVHQAKHVTVRPALETSENVVTTMVLLPVAFHQYPHQYL